VTDDSYLLFYRVKANERSIPLEDFEIIELYLKRDETALAETELKFGARLYKLAFTILNDGQYAEECVNDALLKAWESIRPNDPRGYLLPYLLRIVRSIALNRAKMLGTKKRSAAFTELTREMEECLPSQSDTAGEAEANELSAYVNGFLSTLDKEKRDIFIMRYWFCESIPDIAGKLGCGRSKVKMSLLRIRRELKAFLENKGYII
jgi:RNA polymerase sigma-70 factor (ECF subfamily)